MAGNGRPGAADEAELVMTARSSLATWFMTAYMRRYARRHFHAVRIAGALPPAIEPERGVIVYCNHPSWWDPVMFVLLQAQMFPGRSGFGPMDANSLRRYGVLERIGVFSLQPGTHRGVARFLRVSEGILRTPNTVLWVTAEGGFTDPRQRPVRLRPGVAHLLRHLPGVVAIPLALEFPFWNERTPEALLRFGEPIVGGAGEALLAERLTQTMDRLAEDAMTRDPARFQTMVAGKAGIGGIYDVWRRGGAAMRGDRVELDHGAAGQPVP